MKQPDRREKGTVRGVERELQLKFILGGSYIVSIGVCSGRSRRTGVDDNPPFVRSSALDQRRTGRPASSLTR